METGTIVEVATVGSPLLMSAAHIQDSAAVTYLAKIVSSMKVMLAPAA